MPELCPVNLAHMSLGPAMRGRGQAVHDAYKSPIHSVMTPPTLHRRLGCINLRRIPTLCVTNAVFQQRCRRAGGNLEANALLQTHVQTYGMLIVPAEAVRRPVRGVLKRVSRRNKLSGRGREHRCLQSSVLGTEE